MWTSRTEKLTTERGTKVTIDFDSSPVSYKEILRLWQQDSAFRSWFNNLLAQTPFPAFRWETPAVTIATVDRPFEFVLLERPGLARDPNPDAFAEHFRRVQAESVVAFPNLGRDAIMIVPCPQGPLSAYSHLRAFVRQAPESQRQALWQQVGASMQYRLNAHPVWLNTAGAGVAWLHVRLDDRPKYYGYRPYCQGG